MECKNIMMEQNIMMIQIEKETCAICGKEEETYLSDNHINGIIINGEYICRNCEREIVETKVDENKYDSFVEKIKVVIYK